MKFKPLSLGLLLLMASACSKTESASNSENPTNANSLNELTISKSFNWSSSKKGYLEVNLNPKNNLITEGQYVWLMDEEDKVLAKSRVENNQTQLYYALPQDASQIFLFYPNTEERIEVSNGGTVSFSVGDMAPNDVPLVQKKNKLSFKTTAERVVNGDFSVNNIIPGSYGDNWTLIPSGVWNEQISNGGITTINGNQVYQGTHPVNWSFINQSFPVLGNAAFSGSFDYYRGNIGRYTTEDVFSMMFYYDASGGYLGNKSFSMSNSTGGPSYAGTASISGTTPATCAFIQIALLVRDSDWVDNVSFDVAGPSGDDDGDGITNNLDDYPNDILRAFATAFPTTGYQTLAFEDLWPAKGDFDFNDMVVSNQVEFAADAANNLVDAIFTITLDAVGSGLSNGLAMVLVDANKTPLNQSIINSVSGDAILDPNVTNGIIVFDDVYAAQNSFYQNNGVGPAAAAQTFSFTLTFNTSVTSQTLVPDLYIFRKGERGREIHLHGFSATAAANTALNGTLDDFNGTYITESGLPWAIEIVSTNKSFKHPLEKVDILAAYPSFQNWAESDGSNETDWYASPDNTKVY